VGRMRWREYLIVLVAGMVVGIVVATTVNC